MQKYACVSFKLFIIPFLFFLLFLPHFTIMKHNWLHSVMNEKSLWCWSSQQTKISWSLIFRKRIFMMSCLRFLCTFNPFSFARRRRSERKFSEKNKIIFYDDNNDIDINLWASFSLQNENFLMFADIYIRKKSKRARILRTKNFGVAVEKSTRGQMEDGRVTMWWISLQFLFFLSPSFSLSYYVLVREEHNFSISPAHTHYQLQPTKSIKTFCCCCCLFVFSLPTQIHLHIHVFTSSFSHYQLTRFQQLSSADVEFLEAAVAALRVENIYIFIFIII